MVRHRYTGFVLISVDKVDIAWRALDEARGLYIGADDTGSGQYVAARHDVLAGNWVPPVVSFAGEDKTKVTFMSGQHHFAAARDFGRRSVLVEVEPDQVASFRERFGT